MIGSLSSFAPVSIPAFGAVTTAGSPPAACVTCATVACLGCLPSPALALASPVTALPLKSAPSLPATGDTLLAAQEQGGKAGSGGNGPKGPNDLTEEEKKQVAELKKIDAKVRAHERAHAAVGGQYAGAPSYQYTRGPDGQLYAISGEVAIDVSAERDPEATLQKAAQVAAAALAPADPSGADRAVAAAANALRQEALAQIRAEKRAEQAQEEAERAAEREQAEARKAEQQPPAVEQTPAAPAPQAPAIQAPANENQTSENQTNANQAGGNQPPAAPSGAPPVAGTPDQAQAAAAQRVAQAYQGLNALIGGAVRASTGISA